MIPANANDHPATREFAPLFVAVDPQGLRALIALAAGLHAHHTNVRDTRNVLVRVGRRLRAPTSPPWSEGEDNILRRFYVWHSDKLISRAMFDGGLPRTPRAIKARRLLLGLYREEGWLRKAIERRATSNNQAQAEAQAAE